MVLTLYSIVYLVMAVNNGHSQWPKVFWIASPYSDSSAWYTSQIPIKECLHFPASCAASEDMGWYSIRYIHAGLGFRPKFHGKRSRTWAIHSASQGRAAVVWWSGPRWCGGFLIEMFLSVATSASLWQTLLVISWKLSLEPVSPQWFCEIFINCN